MAGEVTTYRIVIENETDSRSNPVSLPNDEPSNNKPTGPVARKTQTSGNLAMALVAVNQITPYITQAINFGISQISMTTGSQELQRKAQILSSVAGTTMSIGIAAVTGGVPAAAFAAVMQGVNAAISFSYNQISIANQRRIEDESIALKTSRTGLSVNRSRTGGVA